ncbi:TPA: hypothetical protein DF272_04805 [Candidatus Falkowbacteria bacterium]|nr:hypothetical protein [Candidatus Falkowbacteria bacterium]
MENFPTMPVKNQVQPPTEELKMGSLVIRAGKVMKVAGFTAKKDDPGRAVIFEAVDIDWEKNIPEGWTYLKHGTNLIRWPEGTDPYVQDRLVINRGNGLSVVTKEEYEEDIKRGNYNTTKSYQSTVKPEGMSEADYKKRNHEFEIRVLFWGNVHHNSKWRSFKGILSPELLEKIAKYYFKNMQGGRHPVIPRGEKLVKVGAVKENGKDVFYFVPEDLEPELFTALNSKFQI